MASGAPQQPPPPDESVGPAIVAVTVSLTVLILITTSLRLYTRWSLRALGWDDYTIAITAVLAVARTAIQGVQTQHGNGRHQVYVSKEDYIYNNMLGWYTQILLFASSCLLKVSICLLLLRIKDTRGLKILLRTVMVGLFVANFGCIIILLAECSPVETYWTGTGGVCWNPMIRIDAFYFTICKSPHQVSGVGLTNGSVQSCDGSPMLLAPSRRCVESANTSPDQDINQRTHVHGTLVRAHRRATLNLELTQPGQPGSAWHAPYPSDSKPTT